MLKKLSKLAVGFTFLTSFSSYAGLITHSGFTLDTDTNIVSNGEQEWLQWDQTINASFDDVLNEHTGWSIANADQMVGLLANFFGTAGVSASKKSYGLKGVYNEDSDYINFIELFGYTERSANFNNGRDRLTYNDGYLRTSVRFTDDRMSEGLLRKATITDDYATSRYCSFCSPRYNSGTSGGIVDFSGGIYSNSFQFTGTGIALVRDLHVVPEPSTFALFSLVLLGVTLRLKRNRS